MWALTFRDNLITFKLPTLPEIKSSWKQILFIGAPATLTNLVMPISIGIITRLLSTYGKEAVAGFGVASRIEMFAFTVVIALSTVLGPFVGQNYGAKKFDRVMLGIKYSSIFAVFSGIFTFIFFIITIKPIAGLFGDNINIINIVILYITILSISYGAQGVIMLSSSVFSSLHLPFHSTGLSIFKMFILYIPLAFIGSILFGVKGIFSAALIANIISGIVAFYWLKTTVGAKEKNFIMSEEVS